MFGSENINRKERTDSQYHCDRNISRHIRPTGKEWDQSHYIVDKDEKKRCQQIWSEFPIIGTDTTLDDIIVHHHNKHLHESDEPSRCQRSARTFSIPVGYTQYNHQQQHTVEQQSKCHLCDRNVPRTHLLSGCIILYQFTFVFTSFGSDGKPFITTPVLFKTRR